MEGENSSAKSSIGKFNAASHTHLYVAGGSLKSLPPRVIYMHIDKIYVTYHFFLQISNRDMALDWPQNFVSAQRLENKSILSPNFIYAFIFTKSRLGLLPVIFDIFVTELWPLIYARILFLLNIFRSNGLI